MRTFTPAQANRTLPLVRRIVADILEQGTRLRELAARSGNARAPGEAVQAERELRALIAELQRLGCYYKDSGFDKGLVDFPATIDGRDVFLCWRSDEPELAWFHPVEQGYAGRQPIPRELLEDDCSPTARG